MAIDHTVLQYIIKSAAQATPQPMNAGSQAMLDAAKMAKPPGGSMINMAAPQDPAESAGEVASEEKLQQEKEKLEAQRQKELANKDKEILELHHQIHTEKLEREKMQAQQELEKERTALEQMKLQTAQQHQEKFNKDKQSFAQYIQQEQQKLEQQKTLAQAEEYKHAANLEVETAQHAAEKAKQQADASANIAQQQAEAQASLAEQQAQSYVKTTDEARKHMDQYFLQGNQKLEERQKAFDLERGGVSPALQSQIGSAIDSMKSIGKNTAKNLPMPGMLPMGKSASAPAVNVQQTSAKPDNVAGSSTAATPAAQPTTPTASKTPTAGGTAPASQPQAKATPLTSNQAPQQPAPYKDPVRPQTFERRSTATAWEKAQANVHANIANQYFGGGASQSLVKNREGMAQLDNAIDQASRTGNYQYEQMLRASKERFTSQINAQRQYLQGKLELKGNKSLDAKRQLADDNTFTAASGEQGGLGDMIRFWRGEQASYQPAQSAYSRIANSYRDKQMKQQYAANQGAWGRAVDTVVDFGAGMVDSFNPITGYQNMKARQKFVEDRAQDYGVTRNYFGADQGVLKSHYESAMQGAGYNTGQWYNNVGAPAAIVGNAASMGLFDLVPGQTRPDAGQAAEYWMNKQGSKLPPVPDPTSKVEPAAATSPVNTPPGMNIAPGAPVTYVSAPRVREIGHSQIAHDWQNGWEATNVHSQYHTDPYSKTGLGKFVKFVSPFAGMLTGGALKLVADTPIPYVKHNRANPAEMAATMQNAWNERRFDSRQPNEPYRTAVNAELNAPRYPEATPQYNGASGMQASTPYKM